MAGAGTSSYSDLSLWLDGLEEDLESRPSLAGDTDCDVAIVGGGFTGLWTAYYLLSIDPSLRVLIIEREICGFGASGRNGGWAVGELAASVGAYAARSDLDASLRLLRAVFDAVDEIGRVAEREDIDCRYVKGGVIRWARNAPQAARQREEVDHDRSLGLTEDEIRLLTPDEARVYGNATDVRSGIFFAAGAALDPARLCRGLADTVEKMGATIVEGTAATSIGDRQVLTDRGTVKADVVVRATEAYTRDLEGMKRDFIPIYSLMIATEPLSKDIWDEIGLADRSTFADDRYMVIYGQRTADDRFAFGGRGVPYLFGSRIDPAFERHHKSHDGIRASLGELFPVIGDAKVTHRWGGVLAMPRNWTPAVRYDRTTGMAAAGGYVGEGVAAANLAGRTLAELIADTPSERTDLPWVDVTSRRWEIEPLRWVGVRGGRFALGLADNREYRTDKEARWASRLAGVLRRDPS
jgi:glycine/D-amino acid oxidase-like deaminating enzyme